MRDFGGSARGLFRRGAASLREADLVAAFATHRRAIETAAAALLEATGGKPVLLHSGYFRMYGGA